MFNTALNNRQSKLTTPDINSAEQYILHSYCERWQQKYDLNYTDPFNCLLFKKWSHYCKYGTKYRRLINQV